MDAFFNRTDVFRSDARYRRASIFSIAPFAPPYTLSSRPALRRGSAA